MKSFSDLIGDILSKEYSYGRFDSLLESVGDWESDGIVVPSNIVLSIKKFYESTNEYNRSKISNMINISINNIDRVYKLVTEYTKIKCSLEYFKEFKE